MELSSGAREGCDVAVVNSSTPHYWVRRHCITMLNWPELIWKWLS